MSNDLRAVRVPEYWQLEPPSITRLMSGWLAELAREGFTDLSHLGPGFPNPQVSHPFADNDHFSAYLRFLAASRGVSDEKLLRNLRAYGPTEGPLEFREHFATVYGGDFGGTMDPKNLLPTVGSTHGISLLIGAATGYGKPVAIISDSPTYAGLPAVVRQHSNAQIYSVEMDAGGPLPDRFADAIDRAREDGRFVAFYYTIPDGHNPGGISFSERRRDIIYQVCREKDIILVEDAPYTYMSFESEGTRPKPFFVTDPDGRVVHLFTASKIWEPGKRVGYAHIPTELLTDDGRRPHFGRILASQLAGSILFHDPENQAFFDSMLHRRNPDGSFELDTLWHEADRKVAVYGDNRGILLDGLATYFGDVPELVSWTVPGAGFFCGD